MSPRKLTEDDKQSMLKLYRNSTATTSTLAAEFGVSSSTVSRFLKNSLSTEEYEDLIQQKRLARTTKGEAKVEAKATKTGTKKVSKRKKPIKQKTAEITAIIEEKPEAETESETKTKEKKVRRRRRSRKKEEEIVETETVETKKVEVEEKQEIVTSKKKTLKLKADIVDSTEEVDEEDDDDSVNVSTLSAMLGEEIDEDFADDEEDEDEDDGDDGEVEFPHTSSQSSLEILPLASASLPRICYLVVDRSAELIVKPLQEFADLGTIPDTEVKQKTLPVFDNHRVAKRFSHRREKVIKVPNGKMLQKTSSYLYDKGITRLLIRGQIYEISNS